LNRIALHKSKSRQYGTASEATGCPTQFFRSDSLDHFIECGIRSLRSRYCITGSRLRRSRLLVCAAGQGYWPFSIFHFRERGWLDNHQHPLNSEMKNDQCPMINDQFPVPNKSYFPAAAFCRAAISSFFICIIALKTLSAF